MSIGTDANALVRGLISAAALAIIVVAVWNSKRRSIAVRAEVPGQGAAPDPNGAVAHV
jgi:K(+)-stimulated pyrophosphate-energized sodium pump